MLKKLSDLHDLVKSKQQTKRLVLAVAHDEHSLEAVNAAAKKKYIDAILVGNAAEIKRIAEKNKKIDLNQFEIINEVSDSEAVAKAVKLVHYGEADILMKGNVGTATLLKGVLNKEWGLRKNEVLSHIAIFEVQAYHHKLISLTDVAMNIAPDLNTKIGILNNSVEFLRVLGVSEPKVAVLGAVELVNESMPATIDAALLSKMAERGQIKNCIIDGPLAFDNAITPRAPSTKGSRAWWPVRPTCCCFPTSKPATCFTRHSCSSRRRKWRPSCWVPAPRSYSPLAPTRKNRNWTVLCWQRQLPDPPASPPNPLSKSERGNEYQNNLKLII